MNKKELIHKCAVEIMAIKGYHNTKTQEIADKAGVAVGTIYHYFDSKEHLIEYIFEVECDKHYSFISELNRKDMDPLKKIELLIEYNIEILSNSPEILRMIVQEAALISSQNVKIEENIHKVIGSLAELIKEAQGQDKIKDFDACSFARIILSTLHSSIKNYILNDTKHDYEEKKSQLIDFIISGLKK
jgi:TetR/AcrR family transcriptional regulator, fatty acid metabolism regulator protein